MASALERLDEETVSELAVTVRNAGIAGAGGAGFPSYAKWERVDEMNALLVNHQESEPNYFIDKWLGNTRASDLAALFNALTDSVLDLVVIGAKAVDRDEWMQEFEAATSPTAIYEPADLPVDPEETGIVFAYTEDKYEFGMENVLMHMIGDVVIGRELPMDFGWIVQNTETVCAIYDALFEGQSMTHKYVHLDGDLLDHRFLEVPIGTPASDLLTAGGLSADALPGDVVLADGGPGWCFEIEGSTDEFGVRKRTNCLLMLDEATVWDNTLGGGRIDVRKNRGWARGNHEIDPTEGLLPELVNIPLISNPAFMGIVTPSRPIVEPGDVVSEGEMIAVPAAKGISIPQHASIPGEVTKVTEDHIRIQRTTSDSAVASVTPEVKGRLYWTWCMSCGEYVIPEATVEDPRSYLCSDCQ